MLNLAPLNLNRQLGNHTYDKRIESLVAANAG